jgi:hypothetical protein
MKIIKYYKIPLLIIGIIISVGLGNINAQGLFGNIEEKKPEEKKEIVIPAKQEIAKKQIKKTSVKRESTPIAITIIEKDSNIYSSSVGIRVGLISGLSFKYFVNKTFGFEALINTRVHGFSTTGLFEFRKIRAFKKTNLNWEFGVGGYWKNKEYYTNGSTITTGATGMAGLEYKFLKIPFTLGLDVMPYYDVINNKNSFLDESIYVRYIIN